MDTRTKIVPSFDPNEAKTIIGYFDPMHAGHVRRLLDLCESGSRLNVIVADPPEPILPAQARAELVASLNCVAKVMMAGIQADDVIRGFAGANFIGVIDERSADETRSRSFAQHVLARHNTR